MNDAWQRYIIECLGTYILVFVGTGAVVIDSITGSITHLGIAIAFGLVVTAVIYSFGEKSGAHINPAVSIGFCLLGKLSLKDCVGYSISQIIGATLASLTLIALFPETNTLGQTLPRDTVLQSFLLEIVITFILMVVILEVSQGSKEQGLMAGFAVGFAVLFLALVAGPISGASMNPARSIGPALISGALSPLWIYIVGPCLGVALAVALFRFVLSSSKEHAS